LKSRIIKFPHLLKESQLDDLKKDKQNEIDTLRNQLISLKQQLRSEKSSSKSKEESFSRLIEEKCELNYKYKSETEASNKTCEYLKSDNAKLNDSVISLEATLENMSQEKKISETEIRELRQKLNENEEKCLELKVRYFLITRSPKLI
jgi:predicted  nucleic acid-binding Zn-ribbon protein